jgi:hypothetical protein
MNSTLPFDLRRPYKFEESIQAVQKPGAWPAVLSAEEEDLLIQKLGARGWVRMLQFSKFYGPGWGEGHNKQLSPKGQASFLLFLKAVTFREGADPSLFLTDEGELELAWEDAKGRPLQLVFGRMGITVFVESTSRDECVPHTSIALVAKEFSGV